MSKWRPAAVLDFRVLTQVKCEGVSVFWTSFLSQPNFVLLCAIATELYIAVKVNFQNVGRHHLGFC